MAEKHSVAMFVTAEDGTRTQVGWASPKDESGVRTFEYSPGYETTRPKNVSFEDDELSQEVAEEQAEAQLGDGTDGAEFQVAVYPAVEEPQADDLTDAGVDDEPVELDNGGQIVEVADAEDEEAEFQRLLAAEQAENNEDN